MNIRADDLIVSLKLQRNAALDEAATLRAACEDYERQIKGLEARVAALTPPDEPENAGRQATDQDQKGEA